MRKEIPEAETFNKYGDAARAIELQGFRSREDAKAVHISQVPKGVKFCHREIRVHRKGEAC